MKLLIFLALGILLFSACHNEANSKADEEEKEAPLIVFKTEKVAWSCQYPSDWGQVVEVPINEIQTALLFLEKDEFNFITSVVEPFDSSLGSFDELNESTAEVIAAFYKDGGHVVNTNIAEMVLASKKFCVMDSKILSKEDTSQLFMQQTLYSSLLDDTTSISIRISHNNKSDEDILKGIVESSSFEEK